jgi:glycosyltransferase involved in cell wall biosynthesis
MSKISVSYEIILIDDYSTDESWKKLQTLHETDNRTKIIRLQKNFGQANAILCGFNYANGEYIITLDDDLQHPPEEIPKLVNKIQEGFCVVYGQFIIKHHSRIENFFSDLYQILKRHILDLPQGTNTSNFAIYSSNVIKNMVRINSSYVFLPALVRSSAPGNKIANVEVNHHSRKYGKSNYNIRKYIQHSLNLIINYSALPLQLIGIIGILAGICSFIYGLYILSRYLLNPTLGIVGWNSTMVALTFLGGLILFSIAIIGEYLRRILTEVSHGQKFVIADMEL